MLSLTNDPTVTALFQYLFCYDSLQISAVTPRRLAAVIKRSILRKKEPFEAVIINMNGSSLAGHVLSSIEIPNIISLVGTVPSTTKKRFLELFFASVKNGMKVYESFQSAIECIDEEDAYSFTECASSKWTTASGLPHYEKVSALYAADAMEQRARSSDTSCTSSTAGRTHSLRTYQEESLLHAVEGNTIVCLPTGTGKSLIAFHLMEHMVDQDHLSRPVLFLTQNVTLMFQQARSCEDQTSLKVGKYCGGENLVAGRKLVDESDLADVWLEEISSHEACFFTGGLLRNLMERKVTNLLDFSLVRI